MSYIEGIIARQILGSRENPIIEVDVLTDSGWVGQLFLQGFYGSSWAIELRNNDSSKYLRKGVKKAVENVNT